jgi:predicted nucleic acid-binding protein
MSGSRATYLDSSALVKLVLSEPESNALRNYVRRKRTLVSSALARTEVVRAVLSEGSHAIQRGKEVLESLELLRINDRILEAAGTMTPAELRSLDAIHIATAQTIGPELAQFVTYDARMAAAARDHGLKVAQPQ